MGAGRIIVFSGGGSKAGLPTCYISRATWSWLFEITPETAEQLAYLCGVRVQELPDVLQHWSQRRPETRNHLLNRVDPMAWQVRNPWVHLRFKIVLFVGQRAWLQMDKSAAKARMQMPPFAVEAQAESAAEETA